MFLLFSSVLFFFGTKLLQCILVLITRVSLLHVLREPGVLVLMSFPFLFGRLPRNSYICSFLNLALSTLDEIDEEKTSLSVSENRME